MLLALAPWVRNLVLLAALGSLALAAAPVAWHLAGWSAALPERPAASAPVAADPAPLDVEPILALAPFGTAVVEAPPEPVIEPAAPAEAPPAVAETSLDLVLRGILVRGDPARSVAVIDDGGRSQGYRPGDMIAEQARLVEVARDHVVLEVGGARQILSFPDQAGGPADLAPAPEAPPATSGPDRLRQLVAAQTQAADAPEAAEAPTTRDAIELWRERIRANPAEVLDAIGLIPTENGYRIAEQHDSGVGLAGLRTGDVVTSVNGQAVGDVERDRRLFDEVAASGMARIEVQRDGGTIVMSFPLE